MASIVYQIDKKTGAKYAFESISYWDKDKKQPRSKRKYLGKVDPETGEIIPSRGRSTHIADACQGKEAELKSLYNEIKEREAIIDGLRREVDEWKAKYGELVSIVQKIRIMTESI
jgi:predicted RNase H-like nuclease (RuvC/YqgF family)